MSQITQDKFEKFFEEMAQMDLEGRKRRRKAGGKSDGEDNPSMPVVLLLKDDQLTVVALAVPDPMSLLIPLVHKTGSQMYFYAGEAWGASVEHLAEARRLGGVGKLPREKRFEQLIMVGGSIAGHKKTRIFKIIRDTDGSILDFTQISHDEDCRVESAKLP